MYGLPGTVTLHQKERTGHQKGSSTGVSGASATLRILPTRVSGGRCGWVTRTALPGHDRVCVSCGPRGLTCVGDQVRPAVEPARGTLSASCKPRQHARLWRTREGWMSSFKIQRHPQDTETPKGRPDHQSYRDCTDAHRLAQAYGRTSWKKWLHGRRTQESPPANDSRHTTHTSASSSLSSVDSGRGGGTYLADHSDPRRTA